MSDQYCSSHVRKTKLDIDQYSTMRVSLKVTPDPERKFLSLLRIQDSPPALIRIKLSAARSDYFGRIIIGRGVTRVVCLVCLAVVGCAATEVSMWR
jgi:hypothetical protein